MKGKSIFLFFKGGKTVKDKAKEKRMVGVYVRKELYQELSDYAEEKQLSMSQIVRDAIKAYISKKK